MANYQTFSVRFYLKKHRLTQGEAPIYMRISLNAQKIDFSMHQRINPELWSDKMGRASGSVKKIRDLNSYLDSMKSKVTHHFITLRESTENFSLETLRNAFLGIKEEKKGPMVIEKYLEHNKKIKLLEGIDFAPQTIERYETSLKHTRDFIRIMMKTYSWFKSGRAGRYYLKATTLLNPRSQFLIQIAEV